VDRENKRRCEEIELFDQAVEPDWSAIRLAILGSNTVRGAVRIVRRPRAAAASPTTEGLGITAAGNNVNTQPDARLWNPQRYQYVIGL